MANVVSVSFGKDSLAMLLRMLEEDFPIDEVIFFNTGAEFAAVYAIRDRVAAMLADKGIRYTELHPATPFWISMLAKEIRSRDGTVHYGADWCGGRCRWGTGEKLSSIRQHIRETYRGEEITQYVGVAADEGMRLRKERREGVVFPLADWYHMTETDCLAYCYEKGFDWREDAGAGEIRLYDHLARASCFCCSSKRVSEYYEMYRVMPKYWSVLKGLQSRIDRPFAFGLTVSEMEDRFARFGPNIREDPDQQTMFEAL